ncbi:MAG: thiamine pyrophosphate-dependent enzyme [Phycisphaerae bacterium]
MRDRLEQLADLLVADGTRHAFGVTGSGASLTLIEALAARGVAYHAASHEAAAAVMAGAVQRAGGGCAPAITIKGPGVANLVPGIVHNFFENIAGLTISEAHGDDAPPHRAHKRLDHAVLLSTCVRGVVDLPTAVARWSELRRDAAREAPTPIHIDLCERAARSAPRSGVDRCGARDATPARGGSEDARADAADWGDVLRKATQAQRPILIVGGLALRRPWRERLAALRVPTFTTAAAKGALDESLPHAAGVFTGEGRELAPERPLLPEADLLIAIGLRPAEVTRAAPLERPVVLLDEVESPGASVFGSRVTRAAPEQIDELLESLADRAWGLDRVAGATGAVRAALAGGEWLPGACFETLTRAGFDHALVVDTGAFCTVAEHVWRASPRRPCFGSANGRYMGNALPTAIGVALANPARPVVCAVGDGGIRAYVAEWRLALARRLPICLLLMRDGRYGSIAAAVGPRADTAPLRVAGESWADAVAAFGGAALRVESHHSWERSFASWNRASPLFIECAFDAERYAGMTRGVR